MRRFVISMLLALTASVAGARQVADTLSMDTLPPLTKHQEAYIRRLERYHKFWRSLTPDFLRLQYAGSIGLINMGWGWAYARERRFETDIMLGFVPSYDKEDPFFTFTLRQSYMPWRLPIGTKGFGCQPLSCGFFFNSVLRSDYWTREPERYPDRSYYKFSTKIRIHLFVGQRYTCHIPSERRLLARNISAVWELSVCDLYFLNKVVNKSVPWYEMFSLSLGLKYDF